jgi:hypothetical protein
LIYRSVLILSRLSCCVASATWIIENSKEDRGKGWQRGKDDDGDRDRKRGLDKDRQYAQKQRTSKQFSIELNKQIMKIIDTRELCSFNSTRAAELNHVNVATASRKILQKPRSGFQQAVERALQALEESALQNMEDFGPQEIANTAHIMAKQRYEPTEPLRLELERRAEAISGEFNSQDIPTHCGRLRPWGESRGIR